MNIRNINHQAFVKRVFDLMVAVVGILATTPLMATIAVLIRSRMGKPIFFRQVRPGYKAKPFVIYKFRTMIESEEHGNILKTDAKRLTDLGRFLRSTSLDELPELFNVVKGEMSLVGPRPLLMQYLKRYTAQQSRRHEVKPGVTGWAQVNGRNAISWEDKFRFDLWYVDHWSLWLDIKIMLKTLAKVIKREGIGEKGQETMSEFMGSNAN
jgi:lipopolysaccharide/colanic/teichoic acid biosynthesis glycosyltransferase